MGPGIDFKWYRPLLQQLVKVSEPLRMSGKEIFCVRPPKSVMPRELPPWPVSSQPAMTETPRVTLAWPCLTSTASAIPGGPHEADARGAAAAATGGDQEEPGDCSAQERATEARGKSSPELSASFPSKDTPPPPQFPLFQVTTAQYSLSERQSHCWLLPQPPACPRK